MTTTLPKSTESRTIMHRQDFPILATHMAGRPLIYFDNAATTQKPHIVIDTLRHYYETQNSNIHRGVYELSQTATAAYEAARARVARFLNAPAPKKQIIFTRGTTESINLVANSLGRTFKPGDEIIISALEHHSNIVPWQMLRDRSGAILKVIPCNDRGEIILGEYHKLLTERTRIVAIQHVSNALGTINPLEEIIPAAHQRGARVLIDGAQWIAHGRTDVQKLDADFYAFSGHKIYGPTGVGVLYGKADVLLAMEPWQGGGDMIESVTFEKTIYADLPNKFEAGTPNIAGAIGLAAALDYVDQVGIDAAAAHEHRLLEYATHRLAEVPGLRIIGTAAHKAAVISFVLERPAISTLDAGMKLSEAGVAVRTGHHCCQPLMNRFDISSTIRASFAFYNTTDEIDVMIDALKRIVAHESVAQASVPSAAHNPSATASSTTIDYPAAAAASPHAAADELADEFAFLDTREAKNEYLLDLGKRLPPLFDTLKHVSAPVPGCMAQVYLVGRRSPGNPALMEFVADADAHVVRGLIAVLQRLFSGQKSRDVLAFDAEAFFRRIALDQFITSQRRNGLAGMVKRIGELAAQFTAEPRP